MIIRSEITAMDQHRTFQEDCHVQTNFPRQDSNSNSGDGQDSLSTSSGTSIGEFYAGCTVLVTGATGFVGKAAVEKLLRSCPKIRGICVLIREKRGVSVEQRLDQLLREMCFEKIREKEPELFRKVRPVEGDLSREGLGLSQLDRQFLLDNVDIVLHTAANVKFNESLKQALLTNTLGTEKLLQVSAKMVKLKSFVYVSTAYSNADHRGEIEEKIYKPKYNPKTVVECLDLLPPDAVASFSKQIQGKHPNTYTLAKAMSEYVVYEYSDTIPACIVRPSIIGGAWREPFPGWDCSQSGLTGIYMECGRGIIRSILCDRRLVMDVVPVDVVVNSIIAAAWHTHAYRCNSMRVYNCVSGPVNPVTYQEWSRLIQDYSVQFPSKHVIWYPGFTNRTSRFVHAICSFLYEIVPSVLRDIYLLCVGERPIILRLSRKFDIALREGQFVIMNEWRFAESNMAALRSATQRCMDGSLFPLDLSQSAGFTWKLYVRGFVLGVRRYILKDDDSSLPQARRKLNRLYWLKRVTQVICAYGLLKASIFLSRRCLSLLE